MGLVPLDPSKALIIKRMFSLVLKTQKQSINHITKACAFLTYDTKKLVRFCLATHKDRH